MNNQQQIPDPSLTEQFAGQVISDVAAALSGVMTNIGHKLGLYQTLSQHSAMSSLELAAKTNLNERYVREWLGNQVAGQYIHYDVTTEQYCLPAEHVPILADPSSPFFLIPALEVAASLWMDEEKIIEVFKSGDGIAWDKHHHRLFCGSEALFKPGYQHFLIDWVRSISGLEEKLLAGARVADVGCGHGASTIVLAKAFPKSQFIGFDSHEDSIAVAKQRAVEAGVGNNCRFSQNTAKDYSDKPFDLICFMDCLHDMGDPVGAAAHAKKSLNNDGRLLLVEPAAADHLEENINPISRLYYAASTAVCTPCSLSQEVKVGLGAQAGQQRLTDVLVTAGFTSVERRAQTPFNIILEAF